MPIPLFLCRYILTLVTFVYFVPALGALINVTVDDQGTDSTTGTSIVYEAQWAIGPCSTCAAQPDANNAFDGTWHDTTYNPDVPVQTLLRNATFEFTGSALYVFGMIDGGFGIDLIFYLDGQQAGRFTDPPTSEFTYKYNQVYFSAENLDETPHSFKLQNGENDGPLSVVLFDYLIYTKDDDSDASSVPASAAPAPSPQPSSPPPAQPAPSPQPSSFPPEQLPTSSVAPVTTGSKPPQSSSPPSASPSGNSTPQTSPQHATNPSSIPGDARSTANLSSLASSTSVARDSSSSSSPSPSSPVVPAESSHTTGISHTTRSAVIAIAVVVPIIILVLLILLYRAHRTRSSRSQSSTSTGNLFPGPTVDPNTSEGRLTQLTNIAEITQTSPYAEAAPTYYSASPFTPAFESPSQTAPLLSEKGRAPAPAAYSSPASSGTPSVPDAGMSEAGEDAMSANITVWDPVGSISPETAPPMYQSEA